MICQKAYDIANLASQIEKELSSCTDEHMKERIQILLDQLCELSDAIVNELDCED